MEEEDTYEEDISNTFINFPSQVQKAIEQVLPSNDPLDQPDFNPIDYINSLFPNEQSLVNIDDVVNGVEVKIRDIDSQIRNVVRGQTNVGQDGRVALEEAQQVIRQLLVHIHDIKSKAEQSEEMVKEITRDIKQLDTAKRNLTAAITTLNHLHMLVDGIDTLKQLSARRQYGEIVGPLQAVSTVSKHFSSYSDIPQIQAVRLELENVSQTLAEQITAEFKQALDPRLANHSNSLPQDKHLADSCLVISVLDHKIKRELLDWFVSEVALCEYKALFADSEDNAWLDKVDKRFAWLKRSLLAFESRMGPLFPEDWQVSRQIAVTFCKVTAGQLTRVMNQRSTELDVKLLLYAMQRTTGFETLLDRRFAFESNDQPQSFQGTISCAFLPHLGLYVQSVDRSLTELLDRFQTDLKQMTITPEVLSAPAAVLPSCADLFLFYKKCLVQCTQLSNGHPMLSLTGVFQKHLILYAQRILVGQLPRGPATTSGADSIMQNIQSLLREGEITRCTPQEIQKICSVLTTAEYCLETTQQLEEKLKEKIDPSLSEQVSLSGELEQFHNVIANCVQLLVHDLEAVCEPALIAMTKMSWSSVEAVGDQSNYVTALTSHLKTSIPPLRELLSTSRKYFTQVCVKFANALMAKLLGHIYRCKPLTTVAAEQLLLDVHMLKTLLLQLPSLGSHLSRKPPSSYTKLVVKGMAKAEMLLKLVMAPIDTPGCFVQQFQQLLPESDISELQRILEMKGLKRTEMASLLDLYKNIIQQNPNSQQMQSSLASLASPEHGVESSRIKRLEKMIKKRL